MSDNVIDLTASDNEQGSANTSAPGTSESKPNGGTRRGSRSASRRGRKPPIEPEVRLGFARCSTLMFVAVGCPRCPTVSFEFLVLGNQVAIDGSKATTRRRRMNLDACRQVV